MLTNSRRGVRALAMAALTLIVGLPERAWAQQTGLFPLAPIRRQRPACDNEDPLYKVYKYQYYGYHPTCWRRFPDGWGCPSPEAPNKERSFQERALSEGREPAGLGPRPGEEAPAQPDLGRPALPTLPRERDPFELDTPDVPGGAGPQPPRGGLTPRPAPPREGAASPFNGDMPAPGTGTPPPRRNPATRTNPATPAPDEPELSSPAGRPGPGLGLRSNQDDGDEGPIAGENDGPLLAMPNVSVPPTEDPASVFDPQSGRGAAPAGNFASNSGVTDGTPTPRRGLIGNLFSSLGLNWTRR
jgi:hypothetical protein